MSWGMMLGIGQGLQSVGKDMMAKKLEEAREKRQDELDKAKEARDAARKRATPDPKLTRYVQNDGVWFEVIKGGEDNELERRLAPENKVREFQQQEEDRRRSLENDILLGRRRAAEVSMAEKALANYDADRAWERGYKERSLDVRATGRGSSRVSLDDTSPTDSEYIEELLKQKDAFKEAGVPETERINLARMALRRARIDNAAPASSLMSILDEYKKANPSTSTTKASTKSPYSLE